MSAWWSAHASLKPETTFTCADVDAGKIDGLKRNVLPIYEPGLDDFVERNQKQGRITFTTDIPQAVSTADVAFIAVGTPPDEDGSADLRHVLAVAEQIGKHMTRELVVVTKSTVPVGTAAKVASAWQARAASVPHVQQPGVPEGRRGDRRLHEARPRRDRRRTRHARSVMAELYAPFVRTGKPIIFMDIPSAEMTKYAANAMLATRISFMNEIANSASGRRERRHRAQGIGSDARIGPRFSFPGRATAARASRRT
jgi:UDPglucose 6-dehydrogenase